MVPCCLRVLALFCTLHHLAFMQLLVPPGFLLASAGILMMAVYTLVSSLATIGSLDLNLVFKVELSSQHSAVFAHCCALHGSMLYHACVCARSLCTCWFEATFQHFGVSHQNHPFNQTLNQRRNFPCMVLFVLKLAQEMVTHSFPHRRVNDELVSTVSCRRV